MSGVKGRSGKANTPEAHAAKVIAARMGGNAKAGRVPKSDDDSPLDAEYVEDDDIIGLLPGRNPYDEVVVKSKGRFTYLDGKTREQVNGEVLSNEKATVELTKARGELLTIKDVESRDERADDIILGYLDGFVQFVGTLVNPEHATDARNKAKTWMDDIRQKIANDLREARG